MSSANPERWRRIEEVFEAALQTSPADRSPLLERLCGDDADLRDEVESLLGAHAASRDFLSSTAESFAEPFVKAAAAREPSDRPGHLVGRYRLVERIGRGGMGSVWLAERADGQFTQRVALKLIKLGMDTEEIRTRFLQERQILARLEHPNIARLLDGGVSGDGRPYFVMEYVAGLPVTDHCDARKLPIAERLRLFAVAARTVGYAHRNLVVHRDIKPSNVMVDDEGRVRLLDFGIAKLLAEDTDGGNVVTGMASRLMTPEYASPEQRNGRPVTTGSDIYQLGLLLYELLTGRRPSTPADGRTEPIRRPSSVIRLAGKDPGEGVNHLTRQLRGDLDTIVLRTLREESERRYPSAEDLAEDIERHLANQPIRFGGDRGAYRAAKFFRRHRLGVTAGAAVLVLTVGLLGWDARRVRQERDRARHEADKAIEVGQLMARFLQGWSPDASDRGAVSTRKLLGDAALRASRELQNRPEILAATLSVLGDFHTTVGEWQAADTLLAQALAIQQRLNSGPTADRAATLARRGRLQVQVGRLLDAAGTLEQALELHRKVFGSRHPETLRIQRELALAFVAGKRPREAEVLLREILEALGQGDANLTPFGLEVSGDLGYVLFQQARYDDAVAILRPTLERQRQLFGALHLSTLRTVRQLGSALRDRGDLAEAETLYREGLRVAHALYGEDHPETEAAVLTLALALQRTGQLEEAEQLARRRLAIGDRVFGVQDAAHWHRMGFLGAIRLDRGDSVEAERLLRQAFARARQDAPRDPDVADVLNRLAYLLVRRGAPDADRVYREAVAFDAERPADQVDFVTDGIHFLALAEQQKGDLAAAAEDYRRALAIYGKQLPADHPYRIAAVRGLQEVLRADRPK